MSAYERKLKTLKNIKKFELINRLVCYACVVPFFYATSCISQHKSMSLGTKLAAGGFVASIAGVLALKTKEEKTEQEIQKILEKRREQHC